MRYPRGQVKSPRAELIFMGGPVDGDTNQPTMSLVAEIDSMSRPRSLSTGELKSAIRMSASVGSGCTRMPMAIQVVSNTWANLHTPQDTRAIPSHTVPSSPVSSGPPWRGCRAGATR